jgi:WD40 repeat protein
MKVSKLFAKATVLGLIGLAACATPATLVVTDAPPTYTAYEETLIALGYPPPPPDRVTQESIAKTRIAEAYPGMFYTATPGPSPTFPPTFTPPPSETPTPTPTLTPTFVAEKLDAIKIEPVDGLPSYPLQRITGWEDGYRNSLQTYCGTEAYPFEWLDDSTLLSFPITRIDTQGWNEQYTHPVVLQLSSTNSWRLPIEGSLAYCNTPLWSSALQRLILTRPNSVHLFTVSGEMVAEFDATLQFEEENSALSPSGKRLLTGDTWRDLETGETFTATKSFSFRPPAWSQDERRLFFCCFTYWDVNTSQTQEFDFSELQLPGRDGPPLTMAWVLGDSRAFANIEFYKGIHPDQQVVVPLVDPSQQTYDDIATKLNLETGYRCGGPNISPNQLYAISGCAFLREPDQPSRSVMFRLDDLTAIPLPAEYGFVNWSASGQFALLQKSWDWQIGLGEFQFFNVEKGETIPILDGQIGTPVWSPIGEQAAFSLSDGRAIIVVNLENNQILQIDVGRPIQNLIWNPSATQLAVVMTDGNVWWASNVRENQLTQLTPPLPNVRDFKWSPSGSHLAFVSGPDIYVVQVTQP